MSAFIDEINKKLAAESISDEQIKIINKIINEVTQRQINAKRNNNNDYLNKIAESFSKNPEVYLKAFKQDRIKYLYEFGIAFILVAALVVLSLNGILGACESSTILGGIVGYLLGTSK